MILSAKDAKELTIRKLEDDLGPDVINQIELKIRIAILEDKMRVVVPIKPDTSTYKLLRLYELLGYSCELLYSQYEYRYNQMLLSWEN